MGKNGFSIKAKILLSSIFFGIQLFFLCSVGFGQSKMVSGTVTDGSSGDSLPGVNIALKGTTTGTATNTQGHYSLNVPSLNDTLIFSFVGYQTREVPIDGRTEINITIKQQVITGQQVVVVGYGSQQQKDVTGSIGTVDMESVGNAPITGANEALSGQIAGVQVNSTNGIPGGGPQIQVRGIGAIGAGNTPLYVVDGFPLPQNDTQISNPLNQISPSDISSISVLKGPSATAIYGSRASNGVVIIKTKEGDSGKTKFNVNAYTGWQKIPSQQVTPMLNAREFATFMKQRVEDQNRVANESTPIPEEYQNPSEYGKGTDWFDAVTRVAPQQNISISASGGNENVTSYFSGSFLRQKGVVLGTDYNQVSLRANIDANISSKLSMGIKFNPSYSYGSNAITGAAGRNSGPFGNWETLSPIPPIYNSDGSYNAMISSPSTFNYPNPVMALNQETRDKNTTQILGTGYVNYDLLKSLTLRSTVNASLMNSNRNYFNPSTIGALFAPPPSIPSGSHHQTKFLNWANENRVTFKHTFDGVHTINLTGDFSVQQQLDNSADFNGDQYADDAIQTLNAASNITGGTNAGSWTLVSYLARLNYDFKGKYLLSATVRRDGSSRFGPNNRWGTFPSAALGWRISDESWMQNITWLSNLKVRVAYGVTGNNQIGNFTYTSQLNPSNYILGNSLAGGRAVGSLSNPNLKWEKTREANIGLDIGLINDRVSMTAELYRSRTEDLLLNLNIPESSGFSTTIKNIGEVQNKGLEFQIKSRNFVGSDFSWNTNLNFSLIRNKVLSLGPKGAPIKSGQSMEGHFTHITKVGEPIGQFFGYKALGLLSPEQINDPGVAKIPGAIPGNLWVTDANGDGEITPETDFTTIGNPFPKFTYGITNTINYKDLSLHVVATGSYGAQRMKAFNATVHNIDGVFNVTREYAENRYRSPENPGDGIHPTTAGPGLGRVMYRDVGSFNVFNASYLWIKNITLGYTLPQKLTHGYIGRIHVYGSIQNAFIITPYPNGNPATSVYAGSTFNSTLTPGVDFNPYPVPRVFTIGINVNI